MEEDYEIMPHRELLQLKDEIKKLKTKANKKYPKVDTDSVETLSVSINELMNVLKEASKELKSDDKELSEAFKKINELSETANVILEQNEKIAEGIVSLAELIESNSQTGDYSNQQTSMNKSTAISKEDNSKPNTPAQDDSAATPDPFSIQSNSSSNHMAPPPASPNAYSQNPSMGSGNQGFNQQSNFGVPPAPPIQASQPSPNFGPNPSMPPSPGDNFGMPPPNPLNDQTNMSQPSGFPPIGGPAQPPRTGAPFDMKALDNMPPPPSPPGKSQFSPSPLGSEGHEEEHKKGFFSKFKK